MRTNDGGAAKVAVLEGVRANGAASAHMVDLCEGDVYQVGRRDPAWMRRTGLHDTHLALGSSTRTTVSTISFVLSVARASVLLSPGQRLVHILVDGTALGPDPVRLAGPVHEIVVDPLGAPQRIRLGFRPCADAARPGAAARPGGAGTVIPVLRVHGSRLRPMAAALAWPLVSGAAPSLSGGWSTAAVAVRFAELWGHEPAEPRRTLYDLRELLAAAAAEDGRPMASIADLEPWPWPADWQESPYTSAAAFGEAKNRVTALYLAASADIRPLILEALEQPRAH